VSTRTAPRSWPRCSRRSAPVDGLTAAKGTFRLPLGAPIPEIVISQLVQARCDEILETNAKKPKPRPRAVKQAD
jgi:hypothetical protein